MITCKTLGFKGRLGNQLFQIASLYGIAKSLNTTPAFPRWKYEKYFKTRLPRMYKKFPTLYEPHFHYSGNWFKDSADYEGWFQSEKYFTGREDVKKLFQFSDGFKAIVKAKYRVLEKPNIAVSIRRGDFIGNRNYEYIPIKYYIGALLKFDYTKYNILFFSDDMSYCRAHFSCLENAVFIEGDAMEQLCLMTMCENHIISQSTFSWWGAYLSESKRIIRPAYNFTQYYKLLGNDDKDFWPKEWEVFDHKKYKIPLKDVDFLIPVKRDHQDREENFNLCVSVLQNDFDCKITVGEIGDKFNGSFHKMQFRADKFHRTRMLNVMAKNSDRDIVVIFDADVVLPPMQVYLSAVKIRQGADMVYPYDGRFARVPRKWYLEVLKYLDCGVLSKQTFDGMKEHDLTSYGGAILFNKKSFFSGGGENENFISYAPEDFERFERYTRLGFDVRRVKGVVYHLDHFIGEDSYIYHDDYENNKLEYQKIKNMTDQQLKEYVNNKFHHTVSEP